MEGNDNSNNNTLPPATRLIRAVYTDTTVRVYQAYNEKIAKAAVEAQSFQAPKEQGLWSPTRMTWIKPSKVWMAYRCGWTTLKDGNQSRVLALDMNRTKFEELLSQAVLSHGNKTGKNMCRNQGVVVQWDPERWIHPRAPSEQVYTKSTRDIRSIQIGLRPPANMCLLDPETVVRITDVTQDFRAALQAIQGGCEDVDYLLWPNGQREVVMAVPREVEQNLEMTKMHCEEGKEKEKEKDEENVNNTSNKRQAVVVLGCTANPPHRGHLHCLKVAQQHAEKELGYNVLFSTIAVAPYGYVKNKMEKAGSGDSLLILNDDIRLRVLELTADNIMTESFCFVAPTKTYGSALECGRALRPSEDVTVIVVVGGDRFKWNKRSHPDLVTLCCARNDEQYAQLQTALENDLQQGLLSGDDEKRWQLMSSVGPPTSSTMVRSFLTRGDDVTVDDRIQALKEHEYPDEAIQILMDGVQSE